MADSTNSPANNKRPFSAEPDEPAHNKKANIQGEDDDITADDVKIEQSETIAVTKMEGEDSKMEDVKPFVLPTRSFLGGQRKGWFS